ncbi:hypothetical protein C7445_1021 [Alicyclobacillus sacchari]|uniref:Uncharacterized protein n=1 Tax=Alicyclobacillus sacchari TaxID=392010 RepID=A0A4R8LS41_9BACL|nr:hypothetical protein [Alicyclobacillus sacchari]TDY50450.1 hypothetical protein C7445_1021 [Alicyclobacillus sacchari]GMA58967.1 hypothetical protein GCM10025858_34700 [Alicyclobacillus sacchari]
MNDQAGLEGVVATRTRLSLVDGERGQLVYRVNAGLVLTQIADLNLTHLAA